MTDTNQLPEPELGYIKTDKSNQPAFSARQMREAMGHALQASAQVQGEPFGYIHHFVAHDESGALIDTTWEADGCADALPHPTYPDFWKWSHSTPFYTTPQPAQATQAEVTDEREAFEAFAQDCPFGRYNVSRRGTGYDSSHTQLMWDTWQARAILALRPVQVPMTREQAMAIVQSNPDTMTAIRMTEAHHGITAQAKKETP